MTLPASGTISFQQINVELGRAAGTPMSLNDADVRQLAGKPSGVVSMPADFYGKSAFNFIPFATPYGRRGVTSVSGAGTQTANASASLSLNTNNTITATAANVASTSGGYTAPTGQAFYSGTPTAAIWLYFNRISAAGTFSAGNAWVNVSSANQTVSVSSTATDAVNNGEPVGPVNSNATYDVYAVQSASQPSGGPQGTLLGRILIESEATANRTG